MSIQPVAKGFKEAGKPQDPLDRVQNLVHLLKPGAFIGENAQKGSRRVLQLAAYGVVAGPCVNFQTDKKMPVNGMVGLYVKPDASAEESRKLAEFLIRDRHRDPTQPDGMNNPVATLTRFSRCRLTANEVKGMTP